MSVAAAAPRADSTCRTTNAVVYAPGSVPVTVLFLSDPHVPGKPELSIPCSRFGGCQLTETGGVQIGATIAWNNGGTDTVSFKSDTDSMVPEPASLMLLGGGLLVVAGYMKRRLS